MTPQWSSFHGPDGRTRAWPSNVTTTPNGTLKWSFISDGSIGSSPALSADGVVFFYTASGTMYAVRDNGTLLWKNTVSSDILWNIASPSIGPDGLVYVAINATLYAFDASNGRVVWSRLSDSDGLLSSPAVDAHGTVYFSLGSLFCALDGRNGSTKWCHKTTLDVDEPPTVDYAGRVYTVSCTGDALAYDGASGKQLWSSDQEGITYGGPVMDENGMLYVGIESVLTAINSSDGSVLWTFPTGGYIDSPPVVADGVVYVGSEDNNVYAIHTSNGSVKWSFAALNIIAASPAIGSDGTVYVGSWSTKMCTRWMGTLGNWCGTTRPVVRWTPRLPLDQTAPCTWPLATARSTHSCRWCPLGNTVVICSVSCG